MACMTPKKVVPLTAERLSKALWETAKCAEENQGASELTYILQLLAEALEDQ